MRRTIAWLLSIMLAGATGAALSGTVAVLTAPFPDHANTSANAEIALDFYDAVNAVLRTGETGLLDALLAPDMVEHNPAPGLPPTRDGLTRYLLSLHATSPDMRLAPEETFVSGDQVVVRVRVEGDVGREFLGVPIGANPHPWGSHDQFRVVDRRIVEHWSSADSDAHLESLRQVSLGRWFTVEHEVVLERYTWAPGTRLWSRTSNESHIFYLESGTLTVTLDPDSAGGTLVSESGTASEGPTTHVRTIAPGSSITVVPGDLLTLPMSARATIRNNGDVAATALAVVAYVPGSPYRATPRSDPAHVSAAPSARSAAVVPLAGAVTTMLPIDGADVGIGRATLAPTSSFTVPASDGPLLLVAESGPLDIEVNGRQTWVHRASNGFSIFMQNGTLGPGDGALIDAGTATVVRNAGRETVGLLLVTILPGSTAPRTAEME